MLDAAQEAVGFGKIIAYRSRNPATLGEQIERCQRLADAQPGVTRVPLRPRIDGRGALPDLGIYVTVTVSPNP